MSNDPELQLCQFLLGGTTMDGLRFCHHDWCLERDNLHCGCPVCLLTDGLTLIYHAEDFNKDGEMHECWRKRIVSIRTARLCKHLIVEGYPGSPQDDELPWPDIPKTPHTDPKAFEPPER